MPFGFHVCGFQLGLFMIILNAVLSFLSSHMMIESRRRFASSVDFEIRTYADLAYASFGLIGYIAVASLVFLN